MPNRVEHRAALPTGYGLHEYRITGVLGHGGFGITYSATDAGLGKTVAIKEYLPGEFAVRDGVIEVAPKSGDDAEPFHWGLERFLEEARILARFHHPNLVGVHRYFEANGTAYMVMEFIEGDTLAHNFRSGMTFDATALRNLALPLLDGLEAVHRTGYLHRDIKPSNIMLRPDGRPVLLDFGSARSALSRGTRAVTSLVTPGYAPYEQYYNDGNQGPWTDIYALGAILHQIVAGKPPVEAPARLKNDPLPSARLIGKGRYPEPMLAAIDWALRFDETQRPQSVGQWRKALLGEASEPPSLAIAANRVVPPKARANSKKRWLVAASLATLLVSSATAYGVYEYRVMEQEAARAANARAEAQRDAEHAAELQAAALAREIEARQDAERARQASEEAAEKARQAEEKRKAEDEKRRADEEKRKAEDAARAAAEKQRQAAEQERRLRESEEATRKALDSQAQRQAMEEAERRALEQARIEAEQRREERMRRGSRDPGDYGPIFGRTVTRDQMGRPRILTGPINPQAQPDLRMEDPYDRPRPRWRDYDRQNPYDRQDPYDRRNPDDRYVQDNTPPQRQYDADTERLRAEQRAREEAERERLRRDMEERRERQRQDQILLEDMRQRERR